MKSGDVFGLHKNKLYVENTNEIKQLFYESENEWKPVKKCQLDNNILFFEDKYLNKNIMVIMTEEADFRERFQDETS